MDIKPNRKRLAFHAIGGLLFPLVTYVGSLIVTRDSSVEYYSFLTIVLAILLIPYSIILLVCFVLQSPQAKITQDQIIFRGIFKRFEISINDVQDVKYIVFLNMTYIYFVGPNRSFSLEYLEVDRLKLSQLIRDISNERLQPKFEVNGVSAIKKLSLLLR